LQLVIKETDVKKIKEGSPSYVEEEIGEGIVDVSLRVG
jgi:hypothetical protein